MAQDPFSSIDLAAVHGPNTEVKRSGAKTFAVHPDLNQPAIGAFRFSSLPPTPPSVNSGQSVSSAGDTQTTSSPSALSRRALTRPCCGK